MSWRIRDERYSQRSYFLRTVCALALGLPAMLVLPPLLRAQAAMSAAAAKPAEMPEWQKAAGGKLEFDVASVKQSAPATSPRQNEYLTPFDGPPLKGGLFSVDAPLGAYVFFAYKIDLNNLSSIAQHLPSWAMTDYYDVEARAEGNPSKDQVRLMVQTLLEDRFKLTHHSDVRQRPVYALILDKPGVLGPQLQPHPANSPCVEKLAEDAPRSSDAVPPSHCGLDVWETASGLLHARMIDVTLDQAAALLGPFAGVIGGRVNRPAVDRTGLTGRYDLNLEFAKDQGSPAEDSDASGPTFTAALKKQLGLKLQPETGTVTTFVVDHVERPSEN